jgi:hypothetical protein
VDDSDSKLRDMRKDEGNETRQNKIKCACFEYFLCDIKIKRIDKELESIILSFFVVCKLFYEKWTDPGGGGGGAGTKTKRLYFGPKRNPRVSGTLGLYWGFPIFQNIALNTWELI